MTDKIRLLLTDDSLPSGGGKENLLLTYLSRLNRKRFNVHLCTMSNKGKLLSKAIGLSDQSVIFNRQVGLDPFVIFKLRRYLIRFKIQIVHTNTWLDSLYVLIASQGFSVKRIASVHCYDFTWRQQVNRWVLKQFDSIICVSRTSKHDLFNMGLQWNKLTVIHNCYDENRFYPKLFRKSNTNKAFRICMVSRFGRSKDQASLCKALFILRKREILVELVLVGSCDNTLGRECKDLCAKLKIEHQVSFLGLQNNIPEILNEFDCFVFSSLCETFGIALLEAMACGLPVVVSDIASSMELIDYGRCGLFFETGNADSCAKEIEKLIKNPELRESLRQNAYQRALNFQGARKTKELENHYLRVMHGMCK